MMKSMIVASLAVSLMSTALVAQESASAAPAVDGSGSSTQGVSIAGGAVEVTVDTSGSLSGGMQTSRGASGQAGIDVNGVGLSAGSGSGRLAGDETAGPATGGTRGTTGRAVEAGRDAPLSTVETEGTSAQSCIVARGIATDGGDSAGLIARLADDDRLTVTHLCAVRAALNPDQRLAIESNRVIVARLAALGLGIDDVVGTQFDASGTAIIYVSED